MLSTTQIPSLPLKCYLICFNILEISKNFDMCFWNTVKKRDYRF